MYFRCGVSTVIQAFTEKSQTEMKEHPNGMVPMPDPHPKMQSMRILSLPIKTGVFHTQDSDKNIHPPLYYFCSQHPLSLNSYRVYKSKWWERMCYSPLTLRTEFNDLVAYNDQWGYFFAPLWQGMLHVCYTFMLSIVISILFLMLPYKTHERFLTEYHSYFVKRNCLITKNGSSW